MLPGDSRKEWDDHLLNDTRVTHFWDPGQLSGRWFGSKSNIRGCVEWDAYFLYDRGAEWDSASARLVGSGRTVIGRSADLKRQISPLLV